MRPIVLFALIIFFPAFAYAEDAPVLTTYTISHDTFYPSATTESGLATTTTIDIAFSETVKASIKITSENGMVIKSLYTSSSVKNPDPKIWNGTRTDGTQATVGNYTILISATSTATGLTIIDSSKTVIVASSDSTPPDPSDTANTTDITVAPSSSSGAPPEYIPIPMLRIVTNGDRTISSGADTAFTAAVYDGKGNRRENAVVTWSFGDGMKRTGSSVFHSYYDPGEYVVVVRATSTDGGDAFVEDIVTVKDANIKITSVSARGIALTNNGPRTLDLSLWRLSAGGKEFKIPTDTQILANRTILFPSQVIQLPMTNSATLLYPSGEVAVVYPTVTAVSPENVILKPSPVATSYEKVQKVEPIINTKTNIPTNEQEVNAPSAVSATGTAEGAALAAVASAEQPKSGGLFSSPWFLGLIGVIAFAGSAFIFL